MKKNRLFQQKHELWLAVLFGSFSIADEEIADTIYDFAMIEYRHLNWLGGALVERGEVFDYEKGEIDYKAADTHTLFAKLITQIEAMKAAYPDSEDAMFARFVSDERYFIQKLNELRDTTPNRPITAYDKNRKLAVYDLDQTQTDALTLFLFEESYKEYELILVYTYSNFFTDSKLLSNIFIDLIYESHYHLKRFARMMSGMGILSTPRTIMERVYKFDDLEQFLIDGIKEEEGAKEECMRLAEMVNHESLSNFFFFINDQENYHITLMRKALEHLKGAA
jgi:rubrerythrin